MTCIILKRDMPAPCSRGLGQFRSVDVTSNRIGKKKQNIQFHSLFLVSERMTTMSQLPRLIQSTAVEEFQRCKDQLFRSFTYLHIQSSHVSSQGLKISEDVEALPIFPKDAPRVPERQPRILKSGAHGPVPERVLRIRCLGVCG